MRHLSPLEATFWTAEDADVPMHIASLAVFEGPVPTTAEVRHWYARKMTRLPRLRQRLRTVPFDLARPVWEDDPAFRVTDHLAVESVAAPGGLDELTTVAARLLGPPLDRRRALWHVWVIDGLEQGRWAVLTKLHHSLADGVAGIDVLSTLFDPVPDAPQPHLDRRVRLPVPSGGHLARVAARDDLRAVAGVIRAARDALLGAALHPRTTVQQAVRTGRGMLGYAATLRPVSSRALTATIGEQRHFGVASCRLADLAAVRDAFGGSINDVVLAMATTAARDVVIAAGERPRPGSVRCLVPVSVREPSATHDVDNRVSAIFAELPVEFADPVTRYGAVVARMRRLKDSGEPDAGVTLQAAAEFVPPPVMSLALRAALHLPQHLVSTVVTNVPGPREPMYLLGRRMIAHYPYVPIAGQVRVGIAVTSYAGELFFGVTGDGNAAAEVEIVRSGLVRGLTELLDATRQEVRP